MRLLPHFSVLLYAFACTSPPTDVRHEAQAGPPAVALRLALPVTPYTWAEGQLIQPGEEDTLELFGARYPAVDRAGTWGQAGWAAQWLDVVLPASQSPTGHAITLDLALQQPIPTDGDPCGRVAASWPAEGQAPSTGVFYAGSTIQHPSTCAPGGRHPITPRQGTACPTVLPSPHAIWRLSDETARAYAFVPAEGLSPHETAGLLVVLLEAQQPLEAGIPMALRDAARDQGMHVLAIQAPAEGWDPMDDPHDGTFVEELTHCAAEDHPVDEARISLHAEGFAGPFAAHHIAQHVGTFAALSLHNAEGWEPTAWPRHGVALLLTHDDAPRGPYDGEALSSRFSQQLTEVGSEHLRCAALPWDDRVAFLVARTNRQGPLDRPVADQLEGCTMAPDPQGE